MKYENAKDILPANLLAEVQKYARGKLLYIPVENESKSWGEASGYRQKLLKRNVMIVNRYKSGVTLSELAEEYFLSLDSIKKIVYGKKEKELLFEPTVKSAVNYANAGLLEEWLTLYSDTFCNGQVISFENIVCCGVMKVPLRLVDEMVEKTENSTKVENKAAFVTPLIISYKNDEFVLNGQYRIFHELKHQNVNAYPSLLLIQKEEYKKFERMYGRHFISVN